VAFFRGRALPAVPLRLRRFGMTSLMFIENI
jgi:hypothetical protein